MVSAVVDRSAGFGLNLTYRSLASVLKYDIEIPRNQESRDTKNSIKKPFKGYYYLECDLVRDIKAHVVGPEFQGKFKSIECSIMDIADDIAYSTYDLEDAFKGGFLNPLSIIAMPDATKSKIAEKIQDKLSALYSALPVPERTFTIEDYNATVRRIFSGVLNLDALPEQEMEIDQYNALVIALTASASEQLCSNGYFRSEFTSELVGRFVRAVDVEVNEQFPSASQAKLSVEAFVAIELLKTLAFEDVIMSSRLKSAENRGQWIVEQIFKELTDPDGYLLMPEDWRLLVDANADDAAWKRRTICDYIAGMTDAYCAEFYERILWRAAPSIQKQH